MPESLPKFTALKIGGFATWEPQIIAYLRFKGWFNVVNGTTKKPVAEDPKAVEQVKASAIGEGQLS